MPSTKGSMGSVNQVPEIQPLGMTVVIITDWLCIDVIIFRQRSWGHAHSPQVTLVVKNLPADAGNTGVTDFFFFYHDYADIFYFSVCSVELSFESLL